MDTTDFIIEAINQVIKQEEEFYNRPFITSSDVKIVYLTYNMGFMKGSFVIPEDSQGRYYEISYSHLNNRMYIDTYTKERNRVVLVASQINEKKEK